MLQKTKEEMIRMRIDIASIFWLPLSVCGTRQGFKAKNEEQVITYISVCTRKRKFRCWFVFPSKCVSIVCNHPNIIATIRLIELISNQVFGTNY
jgi:hypothetical protein